MVGKSIRKDVSISGFNFNFNHDNDSPCFTDKYLTLCLMERMKRHFLPQIPT